MINSRNIKLWASAVLLSSCLAAQADECRLMMSTLPIEQGENVPAAISSRLQAQLATAMSQYGVVAGDNETKFFVTGRFDNAYMEQTASGTQRNYFVKTTLTLYIGDYEGRKVFASRAFELKGVGNSVERAYSKCLRSLGSDNAEFISFVEDGRRKVIRYFDANYRTYLTRAQSALSMRNYEEAMYYASSVPECCKGYNEAMALINSIYRDYINYEADMLLAKARGAWTADPTAAGASEAYRYLQQIDPSASCYSEAVKLGKEMAKVVKANWDFENVQKYKDSVALEKQRIEAARAIGVAWAKNQPKKEVYVNWIF